MFWGFHLLVGQNKQFVDVTLSFGKLSQTFYTVFGHFFDKTIHCLIEKIISRLI